MKFIAPKSTVIDKVYIYANEPYEIVYTGEAVAFQTIDHDPNGDGTGRGAETQWLTLDKFNEIKQNNKIYNAETNLGKVTIENFKDAWKAKSEHFPNITAFGHTTEEALNNLKCVCSKL
jgi:hypothetical protein